MNTLLQPFILHGHALGSADTAAVAFFFAAAALVVLGLAASFFSSGCGARSATGTVARVAEESPAHRLLEVCANHGAVGTARRSGDLGSVCRSLAALRRAL